MTESELQKLVLSWLHKMSYVAWKNYLGPLKIGGGLSVKNPNRGQPDIYGISKVKKGQLFAIELKSKNGVLSEDQKREIGKLERAGVFVIISRDLGHIIERLESYENS